MFNRPTLQEIIDRVEADLQSSLGIVGRLIKKSFEFAFSRAIAGASHVIHGHLDWISRQVFPDSADSENLKRWASIWGVIPNPATFANGEVQFTGGNGIVIPAGTLLSRADGVEFLTATTQTVAGGAALVGVTAVLSGSNSNTLTGVALDLTVPIAGISNVVTVQSPGLGGGAEEESDDSLRKRLLLRIQSPPLGGSKVDYQQWALEVPGVTRAWIFPLYLGAGTVATFFVKDEESPIIPTPADVAQVSGYIESRRPVTAASYVFAPTADPINFQIQLSPDTIEVREAVERELTDLIFRDGEPAGTILLSRMKEAISIAQGEEDHVLFQPTANFISPSGKLAVLGTISWV